MELSTIWIIVGVVLGSLVLASASVLAMFCWRRSKRRCRGFSLRAVTPLDDAEFESWRQPSQFSQRPQKYGIRPRPVPPPLVRTRSDTMFEKEIDTYETPRTPEHDGASFKYPLSPIRKPEPTHRRRSSVCSSLADRPPTPYSPSRRSEFTHSSYSSRRSQAGSPRIHYPSMSEASAFNFDLKDMSIDSVQESPLRRPSTQSERPLNLSYEKERYREEV